VLLMSSRGGSLIYWIGVCREGFLTLAIFLRVKQTQIDPLHDPVTWHGLNYTGTLITQWDFHNKGIRTSPARLSFVLKVPLRNLRPSVIYSVPCDQIVQRAF